MMNMLIAFLIATLMGMGIGGGGLLVIYLTLCLNYNQILAQGTNLIFFLICATSGVIFHLIKRKISLSQVIKMSVLGSLGAIAFSHFANVVDPKIPRIILGILLIFSGLISIINALKNKEK